MQGDGGTALTARKKRVAIGARRGHLPPMSNVISFDENDANWRRMGRAIRFLAANYLDHPSLEDAAGAVGPVLLPLPAPVHPLCRRQPEEFRRPSHARPCQGQSGRRQKPARHRAGRGAFGAVAAARSLSQDRGDDARRIRQGRRRAGDRLRFSSIAVRHGAGDGDGEGRLRPGFRRRGRGGRDAGRHAGALAACRLREGARAHRESRRRDLRREEGRRSAAAPPGHAVADQGVAGAAGDSRGAGCRPMAPSPPMSG